MNNLPIAEECLPKEATEIQWLEYFDFYSFFI